MQVGPGLRAAGEHQPARALGFGKRLLGVVEQVHVALDQLAFAGAAVTRLAGKREREPGAQQRGERGVAGLHRHGLAVSLEGDLHARGRRWYQVVLVPNKTLKPGVDRKSTRLNSSHSQISYAVFCLKKKKTKYTV